MSGVLGSSRSRLCSNCLQALRQDSISKLQPPVREHVRGKKQLAKKSSTVHAKLLKDIKGYGRRGSILAIAPGLMRNEWYPARAAQYVTPQQMKTPEMRAMVVERDSTVGVKRTQMKAGTMVLEEPEKTRTVDVSSTRLPPDVETQILSATVPSQMVFYRSPIGSSEPVKTAPRNGKQVDRGAPMAPEPSSQPNLEAIYGSVSTADIATSIKAVLAETKDGPRVVLAAEDITIQRMQGIDIGVEADRIKALGNFDVDIRVKGGTAVRRIVSVQAQAPAQAPAQATTQ